MSRKFNSALVMVFLLLFYVWAGLFTSEMVRELFICIHTADILGIIFASISIIVGLSLMYIAIYKLVFLINEKINKKD